MSDQAKRTKELASIFADLVGKPACLAFRDEGQITFENKSICMDYDFSTEHFFHQPSSATVRDIARVAHEQDVRVTILFNSWVDISCDPARGVINPCGSKGEVVFSTWETKYMPGYQGPNEERIKKEFSVRVP